MKFQNKMEQRKPKKKKFVDTTFNLGSGDSYYIKDFFNQNDACRLFDELSNEINWENFDIKGSPVPRLISVQAEMPKESLGEFSNYLFCILSVIFLISNNYIMNNYLTLPVLFLIVYLSIQSNMTHQLIPIYRHPVDYHPTTIYFCPPAWEIKTKIETLIDQKLNHALIQLYRDGKDFIGDHSDKTIDIRYKSVIANVSLGETRTLVLKKKDKSEIQEIELEHGSLYVLGWNTNREYTHGIRRNADPRAGLKPRISLTFRDIATFQKGDELIGQGAKIKGDLLPYFHEMNKQTDEKYFTVG